MTELIFPALCIFFGGFIFGKFVFSPRKKDIEQERDQRRKDDREANTIKYALAGEEALKEEKKKPEIYLSLIYVGDDGKNQTVHTDIIQPTMQYNSGGFHITKAAVHAERELATMAAQGLYKGYDDNEEMTFIPAARFIKAKLIVCE